MEVRKIDKDYELIASGIIGTDKDMEYIRQSNVRIVFLSSDQEKKKNGKVVLGQCEKIPAKYQWCCPYDFAIVIFEPNVEELTHEQIRILLKHELLHVGIDLPEDDEHEETYSIRPHDVEDFRVIIDEFGLEWADVVI